MNANMQKEAQKVGLKLVSRAAERLNHLLLSLTVRDGMQDEDVKRLHHAVSTFLISKAGKRGLRR